MSWWTLHKIDVEIKDRLQGRTQWIINDLRLTISVLKDKTSNDIQPEFERWFNYAIDYIEEAWLD